MKYYIIVFLFCVLCNKGFSQPVSEEINNRIRGAVAAGNTDNLTFTDLINKYESDSVILAEMFATFIKNMYKSEDLDSELIGDIHSIYSQTSSDALKKKVVLFNVRIMNDTLVARINRDYTGRFLPHIKLSLYDSEMKKEVTKNLSNKNLIDRNMVLLAGALSMKNEVARLHVIIDSNWNETGNYAKLALCRMGDKALIKNYFAGIWPKPLEVAINENWSEIEYIKQPESIDWLIKILFSNKTVPPVKETMDPEKIAYYAIIALARNIINLPASIKDPKTTEADLKLMRAWIVKNRNNIRINKNIW